MLFSLIISWVGLFLNVISFTIYFYRLKKRKEVYNEYLKMNYTILNEKVYAKYTDTIQRPSSYIDGHCNVEYEFIYYIVTYKNNKYRLIRCTYNQYKEINLNDEIQVILLDIEKDNELEYTISKDKQITKENYKQLFFNKKDTVVYPLNYKYIFKNKNYIKL